MRKFTAEQYKALLEDSQDPLIQKFSVYEKEFLKRTPDAYTRTFVDLGAGHGRILPTIAPLARNVVAIEINPDMYHGPNGLKARAQAFGNVTTVQGDMLDLPKLLEGHDVVNPVFLLLQNTLGTIEGDYKEVLRVVSDEARRRNGELILSLLRSNVLRNLGLSFYAGLGEMVGEMDPQRTEPERGWFRSRTGYESKWWYDKKLAELREMGQIEDEVIEPEFDLMRLKF